jgi:hypothetical protein
MSAKLNNARTLTLVPALKNELFDTDMENHSA